MTSAAAAVPYDSKAFERNDPPMTTFEKIRTAIFAVTILPLRVVLFMLPLIIYWAVCRVSAIIAPAGPDGTLPPLRMRIARTVLPWLARTMLFAAGIVNIKISGPPDDGKAVIIISNHVSWVDMLVFLTYFQTSVVTKAEVRNIPFLGFCGDCHQNLWVERESKGAKVSDRIAERAKAGPRDGWFRISLFPEGTTSNGKQIIHFHSGAFLPGTPVLPIVLRYPSERFSPAFDNLTGQVHGFRMLTQVYNNLEIVRLPTYHPNAAERADPKLFADNVRKAMAAAVGIPTTEHSLTDKKAYLADLRGGNKTRPPRSVKGKEPADDKEQ